MIFDGKYLDIYFINIEIYINEMKYNLYFNLRWII